MSVWRNFSNQGGDLLSLAEKFHRFHVKSTALTVLNELCDGWNLQPKINKFGLNLLNEVGGWRLTLERNFVNLKEVDDFQVGES